MDVFELVFASYLEAVSNTVYKNFSDIYGTEIQAQVVDYDDMKISYSYQLWRIQNQISVLHNLKVLFHWI